MRDADEVVERGPCVEERNSDILDVEGYVPVPAGVGSKEDKTPRNEGVVAAEGVQTETADGERR
jgi:hypothetical protein